VRAEDEVEALRVLDEMERDEPEAPEGENSEEEGT